jgi:hypothetical protein
MAKNPTLLETLTQGIINAVDDVRHKVVEEGYFGRETTKDIGAAIPAPETWDAEFKRDAGELGIQSGWTEQEMEKQTADHDSPALDPYEAHLNERFGTVQEPEPVKAQEPAQEMER